MSEPTNPSPAYAGGSSTDAVDDGPVSDERAGLNDLGRELIAAVPPGEPDPADPGWQGHSHEWPELDDLDGDQLVTCASCGLQLPASAPRGDHDDDPEAVPDGG